jgi:hypothetical protein
MSLVLDADTNLAVHLSDLPGGWKTVEVRTPADAEAAGVALLCAMTAADFPVRDIRRLLAQVGELLAEPPAAADRTLAYHVGRAAVRVEVRGSHVVRLLLRKDSPLARLHYRRSGAALSLAGYRLIY